MTTKTTPMKYHGTPMFPSLSAAETHGSKPAKKPRKAAAKEEAPPSPVARRRFVLRGFGDKLSGGPYTIEGPEVVTPAGVSQASVDKATGEDGRAYDREAFFKRYAWFMSRNGMGKSTGLLDDFEYMVDDRLRDEGEPIAAAEK